MQMLTQMLPCNGHVGIKLKRFPGNVSRYPGRQLVKRSRQGLVADDAPGTGYIGDYVNFQGLVHLSSPYAKLIPGNAIESPGPCREHD